MIVVANVPINSAYMLNNAEPLTNYLLPWYSYQLYTFQNEGGCSYTQKIRRCESESVVVPLLLAKKRTMSHTKMNDSAGGIKITPTAVTNPRNTNSRLELKRTQNSERKRIKVLVFVVFKALTSPFLGSTQNRAWPQYERPSNQGGAQAPLLHHRHSLFLPRMNQGRDHYFKMEELFRSIVKSMINRVKDGKNGETPPQHQNVRPLLSMAANACLLFFGYCTRVELKKLNIGHRHHRESLVDFYKINLHG